MPEGTPDSDVLAWAAAENRVLITNDWNTMVGIAYQRASVGEPVPGLIVTTSQQSIGLAVDDILLIASTCRRKRSGGKLSCICPSVDSRRHCGVLRPAPEVTPNHRA